LPIFSPGPAYADGLNGYLEISDSFTDATNRTVGAATVKSRSNSFMQRYNLSLDRTLYPYIRFSAGGQFEKTMADTTSNGAESSSDATQISPFATLTLGNPFIPAAIGYTRNEQAISSSGTASTTNVLETYNGRLGLRPEGLPTADLLFSRSNAFDKDRASQDSTTDSYSLSSRYQPVGNLDLSYQGVLTDATDRLHSLKSETITNTATGNYSQRFLANRISFFTSGTLTSRETTFSTGGGGEITIQLSRLAGFFALSNSPTFIQRSLDDSLTPPIVTWTSVPALIDGRKDQAIPSSLINLGVQPVVGGDTRQRNLGLDLAVSTAVNTLYVYVNQNLPASIANQFTPLSRWSIYTSGDNENWTLQPNVIQSVGFETFPDPLLQIQVQRFTINFSDITTRYIKVVTGPLPQQPPPLPTGVDLNNILVTEMEAALRTPAAQIPGQKTSSQGGLVNMGGRVKLLERPSRPSVFYDVNFSYNFNRTESRTLYNYFLSNGLTALHKFSEVLRGTARLSRDDAEGSGEEHRAAYVYSVSLDARPLATLSHNATYSGRQESSGGKSSSSDSFFLTNSATLYRGVSVNLSGGMSFATNEAGVNSQTTILTFGANVTPHQTLNTNVSFAETRSKQSGGGRAESSSFTRAGAVTAAYNPLASLYLFCSLGFAAQNDRATILTQNYGGSWSPFRDGALLFSVSYNEAVSSAGDQRTRSVSPTLRWNIRTGWWLDVSYAYLTTTSSIDETDASSISSTLRMSF